MRPHMVSPQCTLSALAKRGVPCPAAQLARQAVANTQLQCAAALLTASAGKRRLAALDGTKTAAVEVTRRRTRH
jgi:hypothetical protein